MDGAAKENLTQQYCAFLQGVTSYAKQFTNHLTPELRHAAAVADVNQIELIAQEEEIKHEDEPILLDIEGELLGVKTEDVFDDYLVYSYREKSREVNQPMYPEIDHTMNNENEQLDQPGKPGPSCMECSNVIDQETLSCHCNLLKRDLWTGQVIQSQKINRVVFSDSESEDLEDILESDSDDVAYFSDTCQEEESTRENFLRPYCGKTPGRKESFLQTDCRKASDDSSSDSEMGNADRDPFGHYYEDSGEDSPFPDKESSEMQTGESIDDSQREDSETRNMQQSIVALYEGFTPYGRDEAIFVRPRPHFYHFEKSFPLPTDNLQEKVYQTPPGQNIAVSTVRRTSVQARCKRLGERIIEGDETVSENELKVDWTSHPRTAVKVESNTHEKSWTLEESGQLEEKAVF